MKQCRIEDCGQQLRNRKLRLCNRHYLKYRRHGDATFRHIPNYERACRIGDCHSPVLARDLCVKHYDRWLTSGDPSKTKVHVEKHGLSGHELYQTWMNIKARCFNAKAPYFQRYGGRGISMCDEWRYSFSTFLRDVGERTSPSHSIDRINNDGNYEPGNVRWATPSQQSLNTRIRSDNRTGVKGVSFDRKSGRWRVYTGGGKSRIEHGRYATIEEAINKRLSL